MEAASQASVGFLSYGGPLGRWSPKSSQARLVRLGPLCEVSRGSWSLPPAQPDPPTPEASPPILVEDESPQLQELSLTDLGLSQAPDV